MTDTIRRDTDPTEPTPGGASQRPFPMRPCWWQARPGAYVDPETIRRERHNSAKGRLRHQAKFYRDDPGAPCAPEPWEPEYGRQFSPATGDAARAA